VAKELLHAEFRLLFGDGVDVANETVEFGEDAGAFAFLVALGSARWGIWQLRHGGASPPTGVSGKRCGK